MTSTEMTKTELPSEKEIQLKLQERSTLELIMFQKKLKHPRYSTDPQALTIRFHLIRELLHRHLVGSDAYEMEVMAAK
jgi:hypothetical protein